MNSITLVLLFVVATLSSQTSSKPPQEAVCWPGHEVSNPHVGTNKMPTMAPHLVGLRVTNPVLVLKGCIAASGKMVRVLTLRSSGCAEIDQFYKKALLAWKTRPTTQGGKTVPSVVTVVVNIRLE